MRNMMTDGKRHNKNKQTNKNRRNVGSLLTIVGSVRNASAVHSTKKTTEVIPE
jgi:hypothetical protein